VNETVMIRPVQSVGELPSGVRDDQEGGSYRLDEGDPPLNFEYVVGPNGPKAYLFPAKLKLFDFHVKDGQFVLEAGPPEVPKLAFLGVRACELAAVNVQDRVFGVSEPGMFRCESESWYTEARQGALFIAVNCTRPGGTCFCASWGTGPRATEGFDLALTEIRTGFVIEVGSQRGRDLIEQLSVRKADATEVELAELKLRRASEQMGRNLDTKGVKTLLDQNIEHPQWAKVAQRCLSCGNCTMVCPTCFCCTVEDSTHLDDETVTRTRYWESCYTHQFSYVTSGPERNTIRGRYRHWLRHKVATWWDQFGMSGCVGCGRCITWCPVGIDLTEEIQALRQQRYSEAADGS
ncbi:MAG: 4Fe-4S dicluster domain-containing protein, partial [Pirellulaceae bacterium]